MATDGDEPKEASTAVSNADSIASDSDSDSDAGDVPETPVEWLATGRSKRSTAGNRMKAMLATETPADEDSDLELLFQEDADDVGFTDKEDDDGSDAAMESSDEEDENEAGDDDAGEKELERQAKEKRAAARKRKAQEAIPAKFRKKVRINHPPDTSSAAAAAPPPRPKKKSERASWLPTEAEMPTRASGRKTTQLSKEQLHQQMIEREARRLKQVEAMERKAKKKEALKKPPMTQAERLKEAAIVEKRNAKSLNRWEEAEKQREEERRAKLAALNNRRLEGPVVTFWTGIIDLSEVQLKHVGKMVSMEEKPKRKRPSTAAGKEVAAAASLKTESEPSGTAQPTPTTQDAPGLPSRPETPQGAEPSKTQDAPGLPSRPEIPQGAESSKTQDAPGLPLRPETPREAEASKLESTPATPMETTLPATLPTIPASSVPTATASASSIPATEAPEQPPSLLRATPQPASLAVSPAVTSGQNIPSPSNATPNLITSTVPASSTPPVLSPIVKTEPQSSKPIPLALRPDIGPRFMPPPNPHFARPAQPSPLAAPAGMPNALGGQMPALGGYAATPIPRATSLGTQIPASPRPFSPSIPSPMQTPSISPPPPNSNPAAAFPSPYQAPTKQPSPLHTTASFQPILATAPPIKAAKKQQTDQPTPKKSTSKTAAARKPQPPPEPPAPEPPMEGKVTRACIILQDFDEDAIKKPDVQTQILFGWKMNKLAKPPQPPLCVITNHPARYRDPKTGLPYYNVYAFKEIQKLIKRDFKWSKALGTWVGSGSEAAKGVPDRFIRPETEEERKERLERKEHEKKMAAEEQKKVEEAEEAAKSSVSTAADTAFAPVPSADVAMSDAPPLAAAPGSAPPPVSADTTASQSMPSPKPVGVPAIMPSPDDHNLAMSSPAPTAMMGGDT